MTKRWRYRLRELWYGLLVVSAFLLSGISFDAEALTWLTTRDQAPYLHLSARQTGQGAICPYGVYRYKFLWRFWHFGASAPYRQATHITTSSVDTTVVRPVSWDNIQVDGWMRCKTPTGAATSTYIYNSYDQYLYLGQ